MPPTAGQPATSVDDRPHGPTSPTPPPPRPGPRKFGEGAVSGAAVMTAAKVVGAVVAFSALAILARLLPPEDYGLVAMVTSVTAFFVVFSDFGLALVTIQRPNLSREQLSTLFWLNLGFGLLLFAATVGLAPLLVWFYGDPRLFWITAATACVFPLGAVGVQHQAMLKRDMKFRRLAVARIVGTTAAAVAAVAAALLGAKWWSVVIQDVAIAGVTSAACIVAYPWRPGPPRRCEGLGGLVRFGGALTGHGMLGYFGNNMDNILIGRFCGVAELGLYSRSYALMMRPISFAGYGVGETAIGQSRVAYDPAALRASFRRMFSLCALLGLPICACGAFWTDDVVLTIFGPKWTAATPMLRVLFIAAAARMLSASTGWIYVATGRPGRMLLWQAMWTPVALAAFLAGLPWGGFGVASAYAIALWATLLPAFWYCLRGTSVSLRDAITPTLRPLLCAVAAAAAGLLLSDGLLSMSLAGPLRLIVRVAVGGVVYVAATVLFVPLGRESLRYLLARFGRT